MHFVHGITHDVGQSAIAAGRERLGISAVLSEGESLGACGGSEEDWMVLSGVTGGGSEGREDIFVFWRIRWRQLR